MGPSWNSKKSSNPVLIQLLQGFALQLCTNTIMKHVLYDNFAIKYCILNVCKIMSSDSVYIYQNTICFLECFNLSTERTCGKAWTFVRVPGFDLDVEGRVIQGVRIRSQCQALCLEASNLPCRSATFDRVRGTCKIMTETRRTDIDKFKFVSRDLDFLENTCAPGTL